MKKQSSPGAVVLDWRVGGATSGGEFIVQHSAEGIRWENVGVVKYGERQETYQYLHTKPKDGTNFYRVQHNEASGQISYSKIGVVSIGHTSFTLQTNFVKDGQLKITTNQSGALAIFDRTGKCVLQQQLGAGLQTFSLSHWAKGTYYLSFGVERGMFVVQ